MEFVESLKAFSKRVEKIKDGIQTEEATKTSLVMPFFNLLGYDVFNPLEFVPEFTADVGIKKGEKVDYAIVINEKPVIIIEAKWIGEELKKHDSQLFRYFGTTDVKFAILTNGRFYRFYTDLDQPNKMDNKPFLEFDILDIKDSQVSEIKKFSKSVFDVNLIFDTASNLRYSNDFKSIFKGQLEEPEDDFIKFFLSKVYDGTKTQNVIEKFRPILKRALNTYITELMNARITNALEVDSDDKTEEVEDCSERIETTEDELQGFFIVKAILSEVVPASDIVYKDNLRYFAINYTNNVRKNICRLQFTDRKLVLLIPNQDGDYERIPLEAVEELYNHKEKLVESLKRYLQN